MKRNKTVAPFYDSLFCVCQYSVNTKNHTVESKKPLVHRLDKITKVLPKYRGNKIKGYSFEFTPNGLIIDNGSTRTLYTRVDKLNWDIVGVPNSTYAIENVKYRYMWYYYKHYIVIEFWHKSLANFCVVIDEQTDKVTCLRTLNLKLL